MPINLNLVGNQLRINTAGSNGTQLYVDKGFVAFRFDKTGVVLSNLSIDPGQRYNTGLPIHIKYEEFSYDGDASSFVTEATIADLFSTVLGG